MTELSELSYSEVVNDFKVAPSFVLNIRAGKLDSFAPGDVEALFDPAEGRSPIRYAFWSGWDSSNGSCRTPAPAPSRCSGSPRFTPGAGTTPRATR